jgi:hypothetical protein
MQNALYIMQNTLEGEMGSSFQIQYEVNDGMRACPLGHLQTNIFFQIWPILFF